MGVLVAIIGICWLVGTILKEEVFTQQMPKGTDYHQSYLDMMSRGVSPKEVDKRMKNGYYVKKDN